MSDDDERADGVSEADIRDRRALKRQRYDEMARNCPYLDTVRRDRLDFDFEKVCSVTLSNQNVYACLVCGKNLQGRGPTSVAYLHSIHESHHVFVNLDTSKFYCLPDDYEIIDSSLDDIKRVLEPPFSPEQIAALDTSRAVAHDLRGKEYIPGFVGLNNIKANDYINAVVQALAHVAPLRNFFLRKENYAARGSHLLDTFGELVRKIWSPYAFKGHVSPQKFVEAVSNASGRRFIPTKQADAIDFLSWLLNQLHVDLAGSPKRKSVIHQVFQGSVSTTTSPLLSTDQDVADAAAAQDALSTSWDAPAAGTQHQTSPFLFLTLELPAAPLFQDDMEKNILPQVALVQLFGKFDGESVHIDTRKKTQRMYRLQSLPDYLILVIKRFSANTFTAEKNPTVVNFLIKDLDIHQYLPGDVPKDSYHYDLVSNVVHEGEPAKGAYKTHLVNKASDQWFEVQDLFVEQKTPQMIFLSESCIQIWERKR